VRAEVTKWALTTRGILEEIYENILQEDFLGKNYCAYSNFIETRCTSDN
jgi:hypothetical protein